MGSRAAAIQLWASRIRTVAAWLIFPTFITMFVAHRHIMSNTPVGDYLAPKPPQGVLALRNWSLVATVICVLISMPRWQSLTGLAALILFFLLFGGM
jgi:hypothetical protein